MRPGSMVRYVAGQSRRRERAFAIFSRDPGRDFFVDAAGTKEYGIINGVAADARRVAAASRDSAKE